MNDENKYKKNDYEKMKCIWMSSKVIDYKLCDNQFNCEECLFDKAMRNLMNKNEYSAKVFSPVDLISDKLNGLKYDEQIMYLKNCLIAKFICKNTFYLGINPILISFLDTTSSLKICEYGKNIKAGQQLISIHGTWGKLDCMSPGNLLIYDKIGSPGENPWKLSWIGIIGCDNSEITHWVISKSQWTNKYQRAIEIISDIKKQQKRDFETMFDGGLRVLSLHQIVGNEKYISILNSVLD